MKTISYSEREVPSYKQHNTAYAWSQDAAGRPYVSVTVRSLDAGTGSQKQTKTEQLVDVYGNVTWKKVWDYISSGQSFPGSPRRTYNYTYLGNNLLGLPRCGTLYPTG